MKFTLISGTATSDQESDYDTSVDLVHHFTESSQMTVQSETGVRLHLSIHRTTTTRSYLEPDFDEFEQTGRTRYVQHADEQPAEETLSQQVTADWIWSSDIEPILSVEEWRARETGLATNLSQEQLDQLERYVSFMEEQQFNEAQWENPDNSKSLPFSNADLEALCSAADEMEIGGTFEVNLSAEGLALLQEHQVALEAQKAQQHAHAATNALNRQQANQPAVQVSLGQRLAQFTAEPPAKAPVPRSFLRRVLGR